jgi:hypothetical protein
MKYGTNMKLYTSYWGQDKTFKLLPVSNDCPFMEAIYDPNVDMMVVISKNEKDNLQLVPRLDDDGEAMKAKKPKANKKTHKEHRINMRTHQEHYLIERAEMDDFIKEFAVNAEKFDHAQFYKSLESELEKKVITPEKAPLVDEKGAPLTLEK